jgi:DNA repair photolyase
MSQRTRFVCYQPKTILNKGKRADHWFWTRYSAYPYLGCQHGCAFCYSRERKYIPHKPEDPDTSYDEEKDEFSHLIKIKENAPQLLRKALAHVPVDAVFTGDYQPAERKFKLSRQMLEVCLDLGFPVFILTRSPLVLRDMDLLTAINQRARAVVAFSIISTPDSRNYATVCGLEGLAPNAVKRFAAMEHLAREDILTGTVAMPLLPGLCDEDDNLQSLATWTARYGGKFVLGGGLTLADQQKQFFLRAINQTCPGFLPIYEQSYPEGSYSSNKPWRSYGVKILEFCLAVGISDRIPRPIIPGEKRHRNKRIVEQLANQIHELELKPAPQSQIWGYRKAAWAIEDLEQDIGLIYQTLGLKGLQSIPNVNAQLAKEIEGMLSVFKESPHPGNW